MKKKVLALLITVCMVAAGVPSLAMAAGSSSDEVTVTFSAGVPGAFDMVDENITAQGNLAELFFPEIAGNEPANAVSFADVLVAAHIQKYGVSKVKHYLSLVDSEYEGQHSTWVAKQFGHEITGFYYVNGASSSVHVSACKVSKGDELFAGAYRNYDYADLYTSFDKKTISTKAGKTINVKISSDQWGTPRAPETAKLAVVDKETGKMKEIDTVYKSGSATATLNSAGSYYISATGTIKSSGYYGGDGECAGALTKVTVGLDKTKITKAKAKGKKAVLKWKKVTGAKNYEIYKSNKKNGKYKKLKTVKKTSYTDKKVKKGKKYFYKVRAIAKADGKTYKGAFSKKVKVKIKK